MEPILFHLVLILLVSICTIHADSSLTPGKSVLQTIFESQSLDAVREVACGYEDYSFKKLKGQTFEGINPAADQYRFTLNFCETSNEPRCKEDQASICQYDTSRQDSYIAALASFTNTDKPPVFKYVTEDDPRSGVDVIFTNGPQCWGGIERHVTLRLTCGDQLERFSIVEEPTCTYFINFPSKELCYGGGVVPFYLDKSSKNVQVSLTLPCPDCTSNDTFQIMTDTKEFRIKSLQFLSITSEDGTILAKPFTVTIGWEAKTFSIPFAKKLDTGAKIVLIGIVDLVPGSSLDHEDIHIIHQDVKHTLRLYMAEPPAASAVGTAVTTFTEKEEVLRTRSFTVNISQTTMESQGLLVRFHGATNVVVGPEECTINGLDSFHGFFDHGPNLKTHLFYFHRDQAKPEAKLAPGLDITLSCTHMVEFLVPHASVTIALIPLDHTRFEVYEPTHAITVPVTMSRVNEIPMTLAHSYATVNSFGMRVAFVQTGAYDPRDYFTIRIHNAKGVESINLHTSQIDADTGRATILKHYNDVVLSKNTTGKLKLGDIGFQANKEQVLAFTIVLELKEFAIQKTPLQGTIEFVQHVRESSQTTNRDDDHMKDDKEYIVTHIETTTSYILPPFAKSMKFDITKQENAHSARFKIDMKELTKGILSENDSIEISTTNYEYFFDVHDDQEAACTINEKNTIQRTTEFPSNSVVFVLEEDIEDDDIVIDCPHIRFVTHKDSSKDTVTAKHSVMVSHFLKGEDVPSHALVDYVQLNDNSSSTVPVWAIVIVIIAALAIIGGLIALITCRKKDPNTYELTE